jgi:hypothetical protein
MKFSGKHSTILALAAALLVPACEGIKERATTTMDSLSEISMPSVPDEISKRPMSDKLLGKGACPTVEIVSDLAVLHEFMNPGQPADGDLVSSATLQKLEDNCTYGPKSVTIDLNLAVNGALGPKGRMKTPGAVNIAYPFFVAVVAPAGKILSKEVFTAPLSFAPGNDQRAHQERFRQIVPITDKESGKSYKILAGFQLTKSQLDYNRALIAEAQKAEAAKNLQQRSAYAPLPGTVSPSSSTLSRTAPSANGVIGAPPVLSGNNPFADKTPLKLNPSVVEQELRRSRESAQKAYEQGLIASPDVAPVPRTEPIVLMPSEIENEQDNY